MNPQLIGHAGKPKPAQAMALVGVMLVLGILYIRHWPRPDTGTNLSTVEASMASSGAPTTTLLAVDEASAADRIQVASLGAGDVVTTLAPVESISLYAVAAKAAAESAAAAEAKASPVTTTVKKVAKPAATTTTTVKKSAPATTTTTLAKATVAVAAPVSAVTTTTITATPGVHGSGQSATGNASWFAATNGTCAHRTLPFGTIVKITRIRTGATATCRVNDRGPSDESRLIDLADDVFASLAPTGAGLMPVTIEW